MNDLLFYSNEKGKKVTINGNIAVFEYPCSSATSCAPYEVLLRPGKYKIELYGAQGGKGRVTNENTLRPESCGNGSYVSGIINFKVQTNFFLFLDESVE